MLVDPAEAVERLGQIPHFKDRKRRLVELLRFQVFANDVERSRLQEQGPGIAFMLSAVSRPRRAFELARLSKRSGIIARLEELVVAIHPLSDP